MADSLYTVDNLIVQAVLNPDGDVTGVEVASLASNDTVLLDKQCTRVLVYANQVSVEIFLTFVIGAENDFD